MVDWTQTAGAVLIVVGVHVAVYALAIVLLDSAPDGRLAQTRTGRTGALTLSAGLAAIATGLALWILT